MIRTDGNVLVVDDFAGVNNAIDEIKLPPNLVPWSQGGYYTERKEFERLRGKKMVGTSTAFGILLCLKQLEFSDHSVVVFHASTQYVVGVDMSSLRTTKPNTSNLINSFMVP
jgi:hypothetical protein